MVDVAHRRWDFGLTVATVVILASIGVQSFVGTLYVWWAQRAIPSWDVAGYPGFVAGMNAIAAPQVVALVVVMGLCVPKRLFDRTRLVWVSVAMVAIGLTVGLATGALATGLAVYLLLAGSIQVAVVVMTVAGARGPSYLTEGRLTKTGSGLLHLGFIVFAFVVVALQRSRFMLPVFALAALLMIAGTTLSFYASKFAFRRRATLTPEGTVDTRTGDTATASRAADATDAAPAPED